jgi:hypothetical protein
MITSLLAAQQKQQSLVAEFASVDEARYWLTQAERFRRWHCEQQGINPADFYFLSDEESDNLAAMTPGSPWRQVAGKRSEMESGRYRRIPAGD